MNEPLDENKVAEAKSAKEVKTKSVRKQRFNFIVLGVLVLVIAASVAGVMWFRQANTPEQRAETETAQGPLKGYATGSLATLITHETPQPLTDITFFDRDGKPHTLAEFKGRVVVLNLWATWCAPCRVEMPTLAALQKSYDPAKVTVLTLSIDEAKSLAEAKNFLDVHEPLVFYNDPEVQPLSKWNVIGMPTTIILDKTGMEVARLGGEAKWDTPEAHALIDAVAAK
ncbi:redoxin family protein [Asticcacaulis sp. BYS171W]|uniref:Redoxin family protein n=1 Tax=Asticcacaulis aquaticus TaxID=2984212 RepID=A0ABT5HRZ7_9CAUL|nr:redoxin domain-containing protein [Asticcacaulis aquaticus]MDC7682833.1 redoxin family protein [Asticcacaulis aquaticus]